MDSCFLFPPTFVKHSSRTTIAALLLSLCLPWLVLGADIDMAAKLDAINGIREGGIEMANKPLTEIREKYNLALLQHQKERQKEGDLKGVLAATKVLELQTSGPHFSPLSEDLGIAEIQHAYQKIYADVQVQVDARMVIVDRDYADQLEPLIKELTQAGLIDDAVKVSKIREAFVEDYKTARAARVKIPPKPIGARPSKWEGMRAGEERDFEIAKGVSVKMCWIPPGEFLMGSPEGEVGRQGDETQFRVTLENGFWLGKYEVTQEQWMAVMGNNPSDFKGKNNPVEKVTWNNISKAGGFLESINRNWTSGAGFHLPTEAQWEYACRAGASTALGSGRNLSEFAWYDANSGRKPHPVGQKKANAWGLHDMLGNVWEWCADWKANYPAEPSTDPKGPEIGSARVFRGGCWHDAASRSSVTVRDSVNPDRTDNRFGFRLAYSLFPNDSRK